MMLAFEVSSKKKKKLGWINASLNQDVIRTSMKKKNEKKKDIDVIIYYLYYTERTDFFLCVSFVSLRSI